VICLSLQILLNSGLSDYNKDFEIFENSAEVCISMLEGSGYVNIERLY
jgi:hypothetical protein